MSSRIEKSRSKKHPRSIAVVNYKGGVGKTTFTYLLGLYISLNTGRKVLLIDIDAQCSLTLALGFDPKKITESRSNIYELVKPSSWPLIGDIKFNKYVKTIKGLVAPLYVIPGAFEVEDLDIEITEAIHSSRDRSKHEFFLYCRQMINAFKDYNYVIIDTPPNKMYLTQAMLRACAFFIPITIPDGISIYGMPRLLRWIKDIEGAERPYMLGYVLNSIKRSGTGPGDKILSQQAAAVDLNKELGGRFSKYESLKMDGPLCIGEIPRLDQISRFMGADKQVRLDFAKRTSGQPTVDKCLKEIAAKVHKRVDNYNA